MFRKVFDSSWRSLYAVVLEDGFGTAFAVGKQGLVATAYHVAQEKDISKAILLRTMFERKAFRFEKVIEDAETDIALLRLVDNDSDFVPLNICEVPAQYGQGVLALGYPITYRGAEQINLNKPMVNLRVCGCTVASDLCIPLGSKRVDVFEVDSNLHPGMSGGPILDSRGTVAGIISHGFWRPRNNGFNELDFTVCIRASYLAELLAKV